MGRSRLVGSDTIVDVAAHAMNLQSKHLLSCIITILENRDTGWIFCERTFEQIALHFSPFVFFQAVHAKAV